MKKVNLNVALTDLQGNEVLNNKGEKILLNKELAALIASKEAKENALQKFELALKLNKAEGETELEDSEIEIIKETIKAGGITVLLAAQILKQIN